MQNPDLSIQRHNVRMIRRHLDHIPQHALPHSFRLRMFGPGDADTWVAVQKASDVLNTIDHHLFHRQFGSDMDAMPDRCFFLCNEQGEAIGTATAWYIEDQGETIGRVHWVAIVPAYQGRGLAKPMLTAVMNRLAELHDRTMLDTDTPRLVAIKVYLDFGFVPWIVTPEDRRRWILVSTRLDHPALSRL